MFGYTIRPYYYFVRQASFISVKQSSPRMIRKPLCHLDIPHHLLQLHLAYSLIKYLSFLCHYCYGSMTSNWQEGNGIRKNVIEVITMMTALRKYIVCFCGYMMPHLCHVEWYFRTPAIQVSNGSWCLKESDPCGRRGTVYEEDVSLRNQTGPGMCGATCVCPCSHHPHQTSDPQGNVSYWLLYIFHQNDSDYQYLNESCWS